MLLEMHKIYYINLISSTNKLLIILELYCKKQSIETNARICYYCTTVAYGIVPLYHFYKNLIVLKLSIIA